MSSSLLPAEAEVPATACALELAELDEFLLARAMEHDSPALLFRLACEHLVSAQVIRPGVIKVLERVATAREAASGETFDRVVHLLTARRQVELDKLLVVDDTVGSTRLAWLGKGPTDASASAVKAEVCKLLYLRGLDAHTLDLSVLPAERRRFLAAVGRRLTAQALARREAQRRYPILLTLLNQSADEVLQLFDQAISSRESRARFKMIDELAERAKSGEDRQALLDDMLPQLNATGARKVPKGARQSLSQHAGATTWSRRPGPATPSSTGTTGS